ncbi:Transcription elongation factor B polypeptide 1 [Diplonema papillatum]|nr:Transcription elongation factor B polypeptide 1 [Diplonema papillatum]
MSEGAPETQESKPVDYVTLVSAEEYEFILDRRAAEMSKMLKELIRGSETVGITIRRFPFDDISAPVLDYLCQYLAERHATGSSMSEFTPLRALDPKNEEDKTTAIELLMAANYLDC